MSELPGSGKDFPCGSNGVGRVAEAGTLAAVCYWTATSASRRDVSRVPGRVTPDETDDEAVTARRGRRVIEFGVSRLCCLQRPAYVHRSRPRMARSSRVKCCPELIWKKEASLA